MEWLNSSLEFLAGLLITAGWLAPLFAFVAGVITSFMPCCLSSLPLVMGFVGGVGADSKRGFKMSLAFAIGMAITTTSLGVAAALLGQLLLLGGSWYFLVLGVLMVLMSLQLFGVFEFIPSTYLTSRITKRGYIGAFLAGCLGGLFSSPCATPVLVVLLGLVATSGSVVWGILLLLTYSIGHSILVLIVGTSMGVARSIKTSSRYESISKALQIIMGLLTLVLGLYLLYLGF